jgi:DNA-binding transcriptional LysR family regulator
MVVVVKKTHPQATKRFISPKDIGQLQLVLYDQNTHTRARLDEFFRKEKISPEVVLELSSVETMMMMVDAGFGASIVPSSAMMVLPYRGTLQPLRIKGKPLTRQVGVVMSSFSRLPKVIDEMVRLIEVHFKKIDVAAV